MKRLFLLAITFFLTNCSLVFAEVTYPYTVDEKSQVVFGDSVQIENYYGLENYTYDYQNNFLHITFTYTHVGSDMFCCYATFPPKMYVTNIDPRSTSTPQVRENDTSIHTLLPRPIPPGHDTNWYLYDIQFDSTGHSVSVMQGGTSTVASFHSDIPGFTTSDWAALVNLAIRANNHASETMSFTPLPVYQAPTTTPVIIVPGIISSMLKNNNDEKWPNLLSMTLSLTDSHLEDLSLNTAGENLSNIQPDSLIRNIGDYNFFIELFSELDSESYIENTDLFEFPYDWRFDINSSALKLKEKIDEIKSQRGVDKVDMVAHSMGGLVVKQYLNDYGGDSINKFIDIGTPHTGAPKAFKILNYGDNFGFEKFGLNVLNPLMVKEISQNMPSVYQLLPSRNYFDDSTTDYKYYVFNSATGEDRLSFDQTGSYLKSSGRNSSLIDRANTLHEEIDNLSPASYGVETYNIVGCGTPTLGQFYILQEGEHPIYNIRMINGDGTVPLKSAEAMQASATYYVRNAQHALMPSTSGVKELVVSLLSTTTPDISPYTNLSTSSNGCNIPDGRIVSFHSPIELHVYDSSGNHVGPDVNGDIENEISGVTYEVIGDNKFAYLPNGTTYSIKGSATGNGSFDVRIQEVVSGEVVTTTLWTDVALTSTTQTQFTINSNTPAQIELDKDNDGVYEQPLNSTGVSTGLVESTGKVVVVPVRGLSGGNASIPTAPTLEVATSTGEVLGVATSTSRPLAFDKPIPSRAVSQVPVIQQPQEEVSVPKAPSYSKTAIAYKSLNLRAKIAFLKMFLWIKQVIN